MKNKRIWELDFLRGSSMIIMIILHTMISMREFFGYNFYVNNNLFEFLLYLVRVCFILVAGISATLSKSNFKKGLKLLGVGMIITLVTFIFDKRYMVQFGIIHFLGICSMLYCLYRKVNKIIIFLIAVVFLYIGFAIFPNINTELGFLFPIGITTRTFTTGDHFPLIPWIGIYIIGNIVGDLLYKEKRSIIHYDIGENIVNKIGKKSLYIYVAHQPVIFLILTIINII